MALSTCTRYEAAMFEQDGFITMHMGLSIQSMFAFGTASCRQARARLGSMGLRRESRAKY